MSSPMMPWVTKKINRTPGIVEVKRYVDRVKIFLFKEATYKSTAI